MKAIQFLKVTAMVFWRIALGLALVGAPSFWIPFVIAVASAFALVVFGGHSVKSFPIYRALRTKSSPFFRIPTRIRTRRASTTFTKKMTKKQTAELVHYAQRNESYTPQVMDRAWFVQPQNMVNTPAAGLKESELDSGRVEAGAKGEINFAKALAVTDISGNVRFDQTPASSMSVLGNENVYSFWSVPMPQASSLSHADETYKTDVDAVFVVGNDVFLVDTKYYTPGHYMTVGGSLFVSQDRATWTSKGTMSRNMSMAKQRFTAMLPNMNVHTMVVMVPTSTGVQTVHPGSEWTGNIPLTTAAQAVDAIAASVRNVRTPANREVLSKLFSLTNSRRRADVGASVR